MIARAPGKVVLSGAYAVLEGATAVVTAVGRYAIADSRRPSDWITPEVHAALGVRDAPWFDASALRDGRGAKLGIGSSAAILVASLAALELEARGPLDDGELQAAVFEPARRAHARAQGGGSGIDVAASTHGGTLLFRREGEHVELSPIRLPERLVCEVWTSGRPASTPELLGRVRALAARDPQQYRRWIDAQGDAAEQAARAFTGGQVAEAVAALSLQKECLAGLGEAAGAAIVTGEVNVLDAQAQREAAVVLPSGAGGGDIALYAAPAVPSAELVRLATEVGYRRLTDLTLEARGVHAAPFPPGPEPERPTPRENHD